MYIPLLVFSGGHVRGKGVVVTECRPRMIPSTNKLNSAKHAPLFILLVTLVLGDSNCSAGVIGRAGDLVQISASELSIALHSQQRHTNPHELSMLNQHGLSHSFAGGGGRVSYTHFCLIETDRWDDYHSPKIEWLSFAGCLLLPDRIPICLLKVPIQVPHQTGLVGFYY